MVCQSVHRGSFFMRKLLSLTVLLLAMCGQDKSDKLVVGMELAYPPFETKDSAGEPTGISVDLAMALGEYLGKEVVIENTAWAGLIPALQTGKVDIILSSMGITEERKQTINFSDYYVQAPLAVVVNNKTSVKTLEELNDSNIVLAVQQGTTPHTFAEKYLPNAKINTFTSRSVATTEVVQGKADATIYDIMTAYYTTQEYPDTKLIPMDLSKLDDSAIDELGLTWGIAVKKGNDDLLKDINAFLKEFKAEGGFEVLGDKYLSEEKQEFKRLGLDFLF